MGHTTITGSWMQMSQCKLNGKGNEKKYFNWKLCTYKHLGLNILPEVGSSSFREQKP